ENQAATVGDCALVRDDRPSDRPTDSPTGTDLTSAKPIDRDERTTPAGPVEPGPRPRSADDHAAPDRRHRPENHHPTTLRPGRPPHEISRLFHGRTGPADVGHRTRPRPPRAGGHG